MRPIPRFSIRALLAAQVLAAIAFTIYQYGGVEPLAVVCVVCGLFGLAFVAVLFVATNRENTVRLFEVFQSIVILSALLLVVLGLLAALF